MATDESRDVALTLTLESERVELADIIGTLRDVQAMLADIERRVRNVPHARVRWAWADENPLLEVVATVNGVTKDELTRIVADARQGFVNAEAAAEQRQKVDWPATFGQEAQKSARNILKRLERLEAITVQAESLPPVTIEAADVGEVVKAGKARLRAARSAIDGRLDLISRRGRLRATIREHNTGALVRCSFDDELIDEIKGLFDRRVVAEGVVHYREDGTPVSITSITSVRERRQGRPLEEFLGATPNLTGGLSPEEFLATVHGDE